MGVENFHGWKIVCVRGGALIASINGDAAPE